MKTKKIFSKQSVFVSNVAAVNILVPTSVAMPNFKPKVAVSKKYFFVFG